MTEADHNESTEADHNEGGTGSGVLADLKLWVDSQVDQLRSVAHAGAVAFGRAQEVRARCPVDDWEFSPRHTDGVCPLCGYDPPGVQAAASPGRVDMFWPMLGTLMVASLAMGVLVVLAYSRA